MIIAQQSLLKIIAQDSLPKTRQQGSNARLWPSLDDEGICPRLDIDTLARAQNDLARTGGPSHRHAASQHQNRRPCFLGVNRPFRAAYGGNGLRCRDLEAILAVLFAGIDQHGLTLKIDGIDIAVLVAILQREPGAVLGDNGYAAAAAQDLRGIRQLFRSAAHRGVLGRSHINAGK